MEATIPLVSTEMENKPWFFNAFAWVVWTAALLVVNARAIILSYRGTSFGTYNTAGWHWMRGEDLYIHWRGFVYSPIVAAFFAASTCFGSRCARLGRAFVPAARISHSGAGRRWSR